VSELSRNIRTAIEAVEELRADEHALDEVEREVDNARDGLTDLRSQLEDILNESDLSPSQAEELSQALTTLDSVESHVERAWEYL
jgi:DNA repair ATPase RecN